MAVSLSNNYVLAPLLPSSSEALPSPRATLSFRNRRRHIQRPQFLNPPPRFPSSDSFSPALPRTSRFVYPLAAYSVGNESESSQSEETLESEASRRGRLLKLNALIKIYKEAILVGDRSAVAEIEARIDIIVNDTNELAEKVSSLTAEIKSGKEKYVRLQADFDNFRKRSENERLSVRSNAQGEVIESLLPMVDSFERAKQQLKPESEMEKKIDTSYQGIYKQFVEIMRSLRVAIVPTVGKPFDPLLHEAIAREESHEFREGIITQEFRRGFRLGDRLLRPAMVKVSAGPGRKVGSTAKTAAAAALDE